MKELLHRLLSSDGFMPHGHCYLWTPGLLWLHIVSDALITLSYYSIPLTLFWFVRKRRDVDFRWMFVCFAAFILACGTTHLLEIWNVWHADYWLSGWIKALTALASVPTAILLTQLMPQAVAIPSPTELRTANSELQKEVEMRRQIEGELRELNERSEQHVADRTASLEAANAELRKVITERERAEERAQWLASFPEQNPNPVVEVDLRRMAVSYVNPSAAGLIPDLIEKGLKHVWFADVAELAQTWKEERRHTFRRELQVGEAWYLQTLSYDPDNQRMRIYGSDITARKVADAAAVESSERLQTVIENLREGLVLSDLNGQLLLWNRSAIRMHDLESETEWLLALSEFTSIYELATLDGRILEAAEWPLARVLQGEVVEGVEIRIHRIGTDWHRLFSYSGATVVEPGGKRIAFVSVNDITERKRNEELLRQQAGLFQQTYDAILVWDLHGAITFWNAGAERLYGFTEAETVGTTSHSLLKTHRTAGIESFLSALESTGFWEGELEQTARDGRKIVVECRMTLRHDGQRAHVLEANRDITERKRTEDEIRRLNADLEQRVKERTAQLEAANRELEAFSYSVSHDLRSPLRAVDGFAQAVIDDFGERLPDDGQRYLRTIRKGAQRMGNLIDDLLAFSRLSRLPLTRQAVSMDALAREMMAELLALEAGRGIDVSIDALPPCEGDPALLRQVWMNLLSNALKYTRKREHATVRVSSRDEEGHMVYFVQDNGTGFDMLYADKLFGVFQRLHRQDEFEGTGVGLAIVQRIVNRHGGRIWTEASVDAGATFYFSVEGGLPL
jgi:PAS domain S-box-containing protein